ncbi:CoA ester lyase [Natronolimnobius sp. AArcel1]|uniref:HpcH/HpaI aldolase/citrate lyase family protein n=1 Tax=Natronolimnobius sp. AArcel1 TaxID=1679093 RepID=UPI0013E9DE6C|nr:CoA ester lyase [Natronolimnobius sp. AArcel1]NGM71576.1 CoA ester lyase [Natronolimnobius sp. AArcel1]
MARRSVLFSPGDQPALLRKAAQTAADVVVFDLEDAVAPGQKDAARAGVRDVLTDPAFDPDCEVCVRVNADPTRWQADLEALLSESVTANADAETLRLDSLMLPKVTEPGAVRRLESALEDAGRSYPIFALIEQAAGVLAAPEIAAVPATDALVFGAEDLAADIGATRTADGTEVLYARERVVLAAAAHDCTAIDTLVTDFEDESAIRADTAFAVELGYDGKLAIHPAQVDPINEEFTPSADDCEWAVRVLEAAREADETGHGVFEVGGEMIDAPLIKRAKQIRNRAIAAQIWPPHQ